MQKMKKMNLRKWLLLANLVSFSANYDSLRLVNKGYFLFMNNEVEKSLEKLLPIELENIKKLIDILLGIKITDRVTNLEYLEMRKKFVCPISKSHRIKKNGHKNKTQRYWCHDCQKSFTITNSSIMNSTILNYQQLRKLLQCMYDFKPLTETALEIGISKTSVFEIQIRIFEALDQMYQDTKLKGIIQADEKYVRISFKGFKRDDMPRPSRYDGHKDLTSGISKDQLCIVAAIDSFDTLIIRVVGNGNASTDMISLALNNKIDKGSILVSDSKNAYKSFAIENQLQLIQIPAGQHKISNYTINDINEIMTEISLYLYKKKGVSSRHLQHHMNFIRYRKILKYTIEYLEINKTMYLDSLTLQVKLKSNDVYSSEMPFNLEEYKNWYYDYNRK